MATRPKSFLTPEQYLEIERKAEFKSEYYGGEMFAMSGARRGHNLINWNLARVLDRHLRNRPCEAYQNDMRVRVDATGLYAYPDTVIVCGEPQFLDETQDTLLNPTVIIEVLSPSTEAYDRGDKFELYGAIPSLTHYLLVSSERMSAGLFTRQAEGGWLFAGAALPEDTIDLPAVGVRFTLADLYEKVEFAAKAPGMRPLQS
jgi:Uma2 family endonuclease